MRRSRRTADSAQRRWLLRGAVALLFPFAVAEAPAQQFLTLDLDAPPDEQLRAALLAVFDPNSTLAAISERLPNAVAIDELCRQRACTAADEEAITKALELAAQQAPITRLEAWERFELENRVEALGQVELPPVAGFEDWPNRYLLVPEESLLLRNAAPGVFPSIGDGPNIAAVPIPAGPGGNSSEPSSSVTVDERFTQIMARIEADLARGISGQNVPVPSDADPADVKALCDVLASLGTPYACDRKEAEETHVDIVWNGELSLLTAGEESCAGVPDDWPFNPAELAAKLDFNRSVLEDLDVLRPHRATVMIVDTGLSVRLGEDPRVAPFLDPVLSELLLPTRTYTPDKVDDGICSGDYDGEHDTNAFGYGARASLGRPGWVEGYCALDEGLNHIAPVLPGPGQEKRYLPDHGGLVGVIATGGPALWPHANYLPEHISLQFARVFHKSSSKANALAISAKRDVSIVIDLARKRDVEVLNLSLRVRTRELRDALYSDLKAFEGTIVAAAGNDGLPLTSESGMFPADFGNDRDEVIIVAGVQLKADGSGGIEPWPRSTLSESQIDIAAPAVAIRSLDMQGRERCESGTSAAAPQVSFVAAVLRSFGFHSAAEVKRRILATADRVPALDELSQGGRLLNTARALDVFVDQIWLEDAPGEAIRARILPDGAYRGHSLIPVCNEDNPFKLRNGDLDVGRMLYWERAEEEATVWFVKLGGELSERDASCSVNERATASISFHDLDRDIVVKDKPISEIRRIVPARMRGWLDRL